MDALEYLKDNSLFLYKRDAEYLIVRYTPKFKINRLGWVSLDLPTTSSEKDLFHMLYPDFKTKMNIDSVKYVLSDSDYAIHDDVNGWY